MMHAVPTLSPANAQQPPFSSFRRPPSDAIEELLTLIVQMNGKPHDSLSLLERGVTIMRGATASPVSPTDLLYLQSNYFLLHCTAIDRGFEATRPEIASSVYDELYRIAVTNNLTIPSKAILARLRMTQSLPEYLAIARLYLDNIEAHTRCNSFDLASALTIIKTNCPTLGERIEILLNRPTSNSQFGRPSLASPPNYQTFLQETERQDGVINQLTSRSAQELAKNLERFSLENFRQTTMPYTKGERTHLFKFVESLYKRFSNPEAIERKVLEQLNLSAQYLRFYSYMYHFPEEQEAMLAVYDNIAYMAYRVRAHIPIVAIRSMFHVCPPDRIFKVVHAYLSSLQLNAAYSQTIAIGHGVARDLDKYLKQHGEKIPLEARRYLEAICKEHPIQ